MSSNSTTTAHSGRVTVSPADEAQRNRSKEGRAHWANATGTLFKNPWDSFRQVSFTDVLGMFYKVNLKSSSDTIEKSAKLINVRKPDFGQDVPSTESQLKVTWLGHACFLVEWPLEKPEAQRGVRVLFDPVFSHRCSPSAYVGPGRFTPAPCSTEELPEVDAVVISHAHYDHLDLPTLTQLAGSDNQAGQVPHLFLPLNTSYALSKDLKGSYQVTELDWWESRQLHVRDVGECKVTCLPTQHFANRGIFDRNHALWASWAVEGKRGNVWFGGDTGYCSVSQDDAYGIDPSLPVCPEFKRIGERFKLDLGLIPIGAYDPRSFMSPIHACPSDSVRIFKDVGCKKAVGMHWGVWRLTSEPVDEPPKRLAQALKEQGVNPEDFVVYDIGETRTYEV